MFGKKNQETPDLEYFSIYDSKVGIYKEPMLAINRYDILRQIHTLFTDPAQVRNQLLTNAEDFALFKVGEYNKKTGVITPVQHEHIANLHELRVSAERSNFESIPRGSSKETFEKALLPT